MVSQVDVLSDREKDILTNYDSRLYGFLRIQDPIGDPSLPDLNHKSLLLKGVAYFEKELQQEGKGIHPSAFCKLGHIHLLLEDFPKALSAYQKFFNVQQVDYWKDAAFLYGLGIVYFNFSAYPWAIKIFQQVLYIDPSFNCSNEVHLRLGIIFKAQGSCEASIKHFQMALMDSSPCSLSKVEIRFHLGHLFEMQNKCDLAQEMYETIIDTPNAPNTVRANAYKQLAGAMQPSKRGNFFHIESVQPMTEDIFDTPRSEIASGEHDAQEHQSATIITETSHVTTSAPPAPELPASPGSEVTTPESSGAYIQEIHRETSLQESPVPSTPGQTAKQEEHASGDSTPLTPESETANDPTTAHTPEIVSTPAISSKAPSQASLSSESKPSLDSPTATKDQSPKIVRPEKNQAPQGTHVSQLVYLHQQQDILSKPTPKTVIAVAPGKVEAGTIAYTGTVKLKQSWLDQFEDGNSAESKILTGNIEQAFKRIFKNEPKFVNAEVVGFREGLVKHNPNTIRKVIAPFILTFKNGVKGIEERLKNMVRNLGKLDDMPVYKDSLQISEYGHSPTAEKAKTVNEMSKVKHEDQDEKRSAVNVPNGGVDPFLKGIFSQIST